MFGLSRREIEARFTKSEMVVLAWRSQETSYYLDQQIDHGESVSTKKRKDDTGAPRNLPDHFYNENGEVDLRNVTGKEAYQYMQNIGITLPIIER